MRFLYFEMVPNLHVCITFNFKIQNTTSEHDTGKTYVHNFHVRTKCYMHRGNVACIYSYAFIRAISNPVADRDLASKNDHDGFVYRWAK